MTTIQGSSLACGILPKQTTNGGDDRSVKMSFNDAANRMLLIFLNKTIKINNDFGFETTNWNQTNAN